MTLSTSLVAVWYSSDSSRSRVRACNSPSSRAFSIAMTAWSAKVRTNSTCRSVNGSTRVRARVITPVTAPSRRSGPASMVGRPDATTSGLATGSLAVDPPIFVGEAVSRGIAIDVALANRDCCGIVPAKPRSCSDDHVEHRLNIEAGPADDLEHVARRGLVFERFFEVARARLQFAE